MFNYIYLSSLRDMQLRRQERRESQKRNLLKEFLQDQAQDNERKGVRVIFQQHKVKKKSTLKIHLALTLKNKVQINKILLF